MLSLNFIMLTETHYSTINLYNRFFIKSLLNWNLHNYIIASLYLLSFLLFWSPKVRMILINLLLLSSAKSCEVTGKSTKGPLTNEIVTNKFLFQIGQNTSKTIVDEVKSLIFLPKISKICAFSFLIPLFLFPLSLANMHQFSSPKSLF